MVTNNLRRSKQHELLEGTTTMLKDNEEKDVIRKLVCFAECLKTGPMNENDVLSELTLCKDHLQRSHDVVNQHLPSMNNEVKGIIDVLKRIRCQGNDETNNKIVTNLNEIHFTHKITIIRTLKMKKMKWLIFYCI